MIVLADKGLAGRAMEHYAADQIGVLLARPDRRDEPRASATWPACTRGSKHLRHPQRPAAPRTPPRTHPTGVYTRIAQRLLALAACIWNSWRTNPEGKRSLMSYYH